MLIHLYRKDFIALICNWGVIVSNSLSCSLLLIVDYVPAEEALVPCSTVQCEK